MRLAYNFRRSYRRDTYNVDADFLCRLPISPAEEDISGPVGSGRPLVYLICAYSLTTSSWSIPDIGLVMWTL